MTEIHRSGIYSIAKGAPQPKKGADKRTSSSKDRLSDHTPPEGRGFHSIPAPEVLSGLIRRAVDALHDGVTWDRGSILNIEA